MIREATLRVWDEVLPTRLNDPKTGMFIVIMQRSHERDLIGHILAKEFNGMHVCLPAEFEGGHPYVFLNPKWPVPRKTDFEQRHRWRTETWRSLARLPQGRRDPVEEPLP